MRYTGIGSDGLDENDGLLIDDHPVRPVPFLSAPDQDIAHRFGLLIHVALYIKDVMEHSVVCRQGLQLAEVDGVVIEQDRIVPSRVDRSGL